MRKGQTTDSAKLRLSFAWLRLGKAMLAASQLGYTYWATSVAKLLFMGGWLAGLINDTKANSASKPSLNWGLGLG